MFVDLSLSCTGKIRGMYSLKERSMVPLASSHLDIWFCFWHIRPLPNRLSTYHRRGIGQPGRGFCMKLVRHLKEGSCPIPNVFWLPEQLGTF